MSCHVMSFLLHRRKSFARPGAAPSSIWAAATSAERQLGAAAMSTTRQSSAQLLKWVSDDFSALFTQSCRWSWMVQQLDIHLQLLLMGWCGIMVIQRAVEVGIGHLGCIRSQRSVHRCPHKVQVHADGHLPYDCDAGFSRWKTGWSSPKKTWCCKHIGDLA